MYRFVWHQSDGDDGPEPGHGFDGETLISHPILDPGAQGSSKGKRKPAIKSRQSLEIILQTLLLGSQRDKNNWRPL